MMLHSLRFRLLLTLIGVVVVVVGTVALFASRVTSRELQRYVELDMARNRLLTSNVMSYYAENRDGGDPQALVQSIATEVDERVILSDETGTILADSGGELVGQALGCEVPVSAVVVSIGGAACEQAPWPWTREVARSTKGAVSGSDIIFIGIPAIDSMRISGTAGMSAAMRFEAAVPAKLTMLSAPALVIRRTQGQALDPIETGFVSAVNRSLLWAVVAAGVAAVLLTLLLSRRILGPVEALTAAARAMEKGDLSQRVQAASGDEIGALAHAFNAMADGLVRQERLRRNMVTDVAHELRTPLTNIRGYLEALRDGVARPTPALLESLHEEALLLNHLVDDLQDLALAEAGQLRLAPRPTSLHAIVDQAIDAAAPAAAEKRLRFEVMLPHDLPLAQADPERVGQILRNLVNNAITHTPPGGTISLAAALETNDQRPTTNDNHNLAPSLVLGPWSFVVLWVRDTGPGIAPEHLPHIFDRFYRADRSRARATGGAGLGLAIVRQLVEAHGGRVWAESPPGGGARFTFTLPVASAALETIDAGA